LAETKVSTKYALVQSKVRNNASHI